MPIHVPGCHSFSYKHSASVSSILASAFKFRQPLYSLCRNAYNECTLFNILIYYCSRTNGCSHADIQALYYRAISPDVATLANLHVSTNISSRSNRREIPNSNVVPNCTVQVYMDMFPHLNLSGKYCSCAYNGTFPNLNVLGHSHRRVYYTKISDSHRS